MLMAHPRVVGTAQTPYRRFRQHTTGRGGDSRARSVAYRAAGDQRRRIERDIAPDHSRSADGRHWNTFDRYLQTAGIAGAHRQARLIRRTVALARFQHALEEHRPAGIADLDPAVAGGPDDDPPR